MATPLVHVEEWADEHVTLRDVERALCRLREESAHETEGPDLRTSVMTHIAWVPAEWHEAALETLAGLAERHPSRTIVLFPEPDSPDSLDARASILAFPVTGARRHIASEVVELTLRGRRSAAPASLVSPLLVSDLPVFVRWRGRPDFASAELEQLTGLADRLIVDSAEWPDVPAAYAELAALFARVAVSDIAWRRTLPARRGLAGGWPAIANVRQLRVAAPAAEAHLVAGWLRSRLDTEVELVHDDAETLELVVADGERVPLPGEAQSPSELLSAELDELGRDPVYEAAVASA